MPAELAVGAAQGNQPELEPEFLQIGFAAPLANGTACTSNVAAKTDENPASAKAKTPVKYEPTSCPASGKILLNEGVRVLDKALLGTAFEVIGPVSPIYLTCTP